MDLPKIKANLLRADGKEGRITLAKALEELIPEFRELRKKGWSWERIWSRLVESGFEIDRRYFTRIAPRIVGEAENPRRIKHARKEVLETKSEQKIPDKAGLRDLPARKKEPQTSPQAPEKQGKSQYKSHFDLPEDTEL
ncbi:MAG: hypothetical protein M1313_08495 [Nitrospirae bacterium]|jgi:transposase|nr:hypothetical protein [Nitrospirota bacterium]